LEVSVRKWTIPLTFVGLSGLGAMLFSERGRKLIHSMAERFSGTPGRLAAWNDPAQKELDKIQQAVKELEQSLGTHTAQ
jgi:hypothetical protein